MKPNAAHHRKISVLQWCLIALFASALMGIFLSYLAPDMLYAIASQAWALCGW